MNAHTVIRLLIASLVVGALLALIDVSPADFWLDLFRNFVDFVRWIVGKAGRLAGFALSGALIVIPIWLLMRAIEWSKGAARPAARRR